VTNIDKRIGVILCIVGILSFAAWPVWNWIMIKPVSTTLHERTKALVDKNPQLKPAWEIALQDDTLTMPEAKVIVEAAGEKIGPEE
jgi:hypothetical protein